MKKNRNNFFLYFSIFSGYFYPFFTRFLHKNCLSFIALLSKTYYFRVFGVTHHESVPEFRKSLAQNVDGRSKMDTRNVKNAVNQQFLWNYLLRGFWGRLSGIRSSRIIQQFCRLFGSIILSSSCLVKEFWMSECGFLISDLKNPWVINFTWMIFLTFFKIFINHTSLPPPLSILIYFS